jgi:hypothetical protein
MALVNKNIASAFGYAVFGRAVLNLDFDSQDIPSELYDKFRAVCGLARPTGKVEKRYPWSVNQPNTLKQKVVRKAFLDNIAVFNVLTPEEREVWYNESISSGLFYYDYFQQQTLPVYYFSTLGQAVLRRAYLARN